MGSVLLITGCTEQPEPSEKEVVNNTIEKFESANDYSYLIILNSSEYEEVNNVTIEMFYESSGKGKMIIEKSYEDLMYVVVNNGNNILTYDSEHDVVTRNPDPISNVFQENPLTYYSLMERIIENNKPVLQGTETINGNKTYILEFVFESSISDFPVDSTKLWINSDNWSPVKYELYKNEKIVISAAFKNFRFNTGISDKKFEYQPPKNAKVIEQQKSAPQTVTLEEVKNSVDYELKKPSYVPDEFEFDHVQYTPSTSSVVIYYENDVMRSVLAVVQMPYESSQKPEVAGQENTTIGTTKGNYFESTNSKHLKWSENNIEYTIMLNPPLERDNEIDKREMIKIAESLEPVE
ncbi:Outer membrane lipoprotein-sorting protein-like protein [Methanohalobium evestigatum Z-7303]|uniref:Outer membrane lipoprotein-sorting protein-like protein n=2 Tax=root TaxID=1 RepID=D7E6F2_METEZ|nr:DUF4367 domain-containing protein [Methanohalobium evestigatum]ADI73174.1 Outer membrane lipoprotein-sorting protein-like protein [Methanohalobium evestigatum Z-7303]